MDKCVGRKAVQRKRKMKYFIDATTQIIDNEGVDAVTIRGVSDIAGYNSATMYNYFKNIDHLIYYSYMKYILELELQLQPLITEKSSNIDKLKALWNEFSIYAFNRFEVVYYLVFAPFNNEFSDVLNDYMEVFDSSSSYENEDEVNKIFKDSIFDVISDAIKKFGQELVLDEAEIYDLEEFVLTYFHGQLARLKTGNNNMDLKTFVDKMNRYMDYLLWTYITSKN